MPKVGAEQDIRNNFMTIYPAILAIDIGKNMGWAFQSKSAAMFSGCQKFTLKQKVLQDTPNADAQYNYNFKTFLNGISPDKIDAVYFEEVHRVHTALRAAAVYFGFRATLLLWAYEREIPVVAVPIGTWRKYVYGKAPSTRAGAKAKAIKVAAELGCITKNDNEAEAFCILQYAKQHHQMM